MKKLEFIENITAVINGSKEVFSHDKLAIRQLFVNMLDNYDKNGLITVAQAKNWFLTDKELNKLYNLATKRIGA